MKRHLVRILFAANAVNLLALLTLCGLLLTPATADVTLIPQSCCNYIPAPNTCSGCIAINDPTGFVSVPNTAVYRCNASSTMPQAWQCGSQRVTCFSNPSNETYYSDQNCTIKSGVIMGPFTLTLLECSMPPSTSCETGE